MHPVYVQLQVFSPKPGFNSDSAKGIVRRRSSAVSGCCFYAVFPWILIPFQESFQGDEDILLQPRKYCELRGMENILEGSKQRN